ncbi:hypothetical protein [Streptomyces sp. NPDC091219]|uniref:hypothetical protein n=1 Tax=Streptomyces sp. NPDC091219 TaxID=3155193 RepID=UPI00344DE83E
MAASGTEASAAPPKVLNPLWIISLFLTVSEVSVGAAATQTQGWLQALLVIYSVFFPTAVAATFFGILVKKPYVLYAPKDYSSNPSVNDFVSALNSSRVRGIENMEASIRQAMEEVVPKIIDETFARPDREELVANAVRVAQADFLQRTIHVSFLALDVTLSDLVLPVSDDTPVQQVLDEVWSAQGVVAAHSYGRDWVLFDADTKHQYRDMGSAYAQRNRIGLVDSRPISEVGIRPGARLVAARLR